MPNRMAFPLAGADMPRVWIVSGAFSPAGASDPTTPGGNATAAVAGWPGTSTNTGWGPAGFGRFISTVKHTSTGKYTLTFTDVGQAVVSMWAQLATDDNSKTFWAVPSAVFDFTNKQWVIYTLQSSGAVPGAAVVDVPATSKPVITFGIMFTDASAGEQG